MPKQKTHLCTWPMLCTLLMLTHSPTWAADSQQLENQSFAEAMGLARQGQFVEAEERFEALLTQNADLHRVRLELALVYAKLGKTGQAEAQLRRVLRVEGLPKTVRNNVQRLLHRLTKNTPKPASKHSFQFTFESSLGSDSNVAFGSDELLEPGLDEFNEGDAWVDDWTDEWVDWDAPIDDWPIEDDLDFDLSDDYEADTYVDEDLFFDEDFLAALESGAIEITEDGYYDEDGNFFPFDDLFARPERQKDSPFLEARLNIHHQYTPDWKGLPAGRLKWANQLALNTLKNVDAEAFDESNLALSSKLSWQWSPGLRSSAGVSYRQLQRDKETLVSYRGFTFATEYSASFGVISLTYDQLGKDYNDDLYDEYDADYTAYAVSWGNALYENNLFLTLQAKLAKNDSLEGISDYRSQNYGVNLLYRWNDTWHSQVGVSRLRFDYDEFWKETFTRLKARLTYQHDSALQFFIAGEQAERQLPEGYPDEDRTLIKAGFKWQYEAQ